MKPLAWAVLLGFAVVLLLAFPRASGPADELRYAPSEGALALERASDREARSVG